MIEDEPSTDLNELFPALSDISNSFLDNDDQATYDISVADQISSNNSNDKDSLFKNAIFICSICYKKSFAKSTYELHRLTHKNQVFVCKEVGCGAQFNLKKKLCAHKKNSRHDPDLSHECKQCTERFSSRTALVQHKEKKHRSAPINTMIRNLNKDTECMSEDGVLDVMLEVVLEKTDDVSSTLQDVIKKHVCKDPHCGVSFQSEAYLRRHEKEPHDSSLPRVCSRCLLKFSSRSALIRHNKKCHPTKNKNKFVCDDENCKAIFADKYLLKRHLKKPHDLHLSCFGCLREFSSRYGLTQHSIVHQKNLTVDKKNSKKRKRCDKTKMDVKLKKYICSKPSCGASFKDKYRKKNHKKAPHDSTLPYICSKCPLKFSSRGAATQHYKRHNNDKVHRTYSCEEPFCGLLFETKGNFKRHKKVPHDLTLPHCCTQCEAKFSSIGSLTKHVLDFSHQKNSKRAKKKQKV